MTSSKNDENKKCVMNGNEKNEGGCREGPIEYSNTC